MHSSNSARAIAAALVWLSLVAGAAADDWMVDRLRGQALVKIGGVWQELVRGDVVSDTSPIKSLDGSRLTLVRGLERIELDGATEIRIFDQVGERMTTVMQAYGTVTVEAERLNVQHFSVQTPYLAAIVKGTQFTVVSDDTQSSVKVSRGLVQVQDYEHDRATDIVPGQTAIVGQDVALDVTGPGPATPVVTLDGVIITAAQDDLIVDEAPAGNQQAAGNGSGNGNAGSNGNSGNGNGNAGNNGNAGGNGSGNAGNNGNGNAGNNGNGNAGGNGNGNAGGNGNGNAGGNGNGNAGGNGNGNAGNNGNGNAGNNGNGNGNGRNDEDD